MTTHVINMELSSYATREDVDPYDMDTWNATVQINVENPYQGRGKMRHTLSFSGADNCHRDTQGGPVHQHAYAFLSPQASVISARFIEPEPSIDAAIGDLLVFPGRDVVLKVVPGARFDRFDNTAVEVLHCLPATVDHSEWAAKTNGQPKRYISESEMSS